MLDSNVLIATALASEAGVRARLAQCDAGDLVVSAVSLAEVLHGSMRDKPPPVAELLLLIEEMPVLAFDGPAAKAYATIPFRRSSFDRLIAAHALSLGLTVVTFNQKDFADVPGLVVENWTI